jgi:aspartate aminotransferase
MNTTVFGTISNSKATSLRPVGGVEHDNGFTRSLNLNVRGIGESATLAIQERCRKLTKDGVKVANFGLGQSPFPVPKPVVEALKLHAHEKDYLPVRGLPALREAVAAFHRRLDGIDAAGDLVLVGPGSKELMFLLQMVFYGELILPSPCWVSYGPQARILGKQIRILPTRHEQRWRLSAEHLDTFLAAEGDESRPRILVLNYPGNPDGLTYDIEELTAIAAVARKWNVVVLSDEIYGQIHHRGEHVSIARFYPDGTIVSSGLSKWCGAGGWRLGTMTFPPALVWLLEAMAFVASETYTSVSAPIQYAAVHAFKGGVEIERYLRNVRRILAGLGSCAYGLLGETGIGVQRPTGGFYLFLDFEPLRERLERRGVDCGRTLCERLLAEASVAVLPGAVFERPAEELTARLAYVNFDGSAALTASEAIAPHEGLNDSFFEHYCLETLNGCRRIATWVYEQ